MREGRPVSRVRRRECHFSNTVVQEAVRADEEQQRQLNFLKRRRRLKYFPFYPVRSY